MGTQENQQLSLWHSDISEALTADVQRLGGNKYVGSLLWPELDPVEAGKKLARCLSDGRRDKLSPEQVVLIIIKSAREGGNASMSFIAEKAGFKPPELKPRETEMAKLQREFIEATKRQERILASLQSMGAA